VQTSLEGVHGLRDEAWDHVAFSIIRASLQDICSAAK
jgi:hypothetical protein